MLQLLSSGLLLVDFNMTAHFYKLQCTRLAFKKAKVIRFALFQKIKELTDLVVQDMYIHNYNLQVIWLLHRDMLPVFNMQLFHVYKH